MFNFLFQFQMKAGVKLLSSFLCLLLLIITSNFAFGQKNSLRGKRLVFNFSVSKTSNLVHQINCLADINCNDSGNYQNLWKDSPELGLKTEDDAQLAKWRELYRKYNGEIAVQSEQQNNAKLAYPLSAGNNDKISLNNRLRIAALNSTNWEEYRRAVELLVLPKDAHEFVAVVRHFSSRFDEWWQKSNSEKFLNERGKQYIASIEKHQLLELTEKAAVFYEAQIPESYQVGFHLLFRPANDSVFGEQIENHALIEVREKESLEEKIPVVIHELAHHLFRLAPLRQQEKLLGSFLGANQIYSLAAYNLLDEALATAIGNGLVAKRLMSEKDFAAYKERPNSFYIDDAVDRAGKAVFPLVEQRINQNSSLYAGDFAPEYLELIGTAFGEEINSPLLALKTLTIISNPELRPVAQKLRNIVFPGNYSRFSPFNAENGWDFIKQNSELSPIIIVQKNELQQLKPQQRVLSAADIEKIGKVAAGKNNFVYGARRSPKATAYVFVGTDVPALEKLVEEFFKRKTGFDGVGVSLQP